MEGDYPAATHPLERYVPRILAEWDLDAPGQRWRRFDGTLCFVDISGFTNLSEKLARRGRIGAEELTEVLNRVFGTMLRLAYDRGGHLLKFGGDALLLLFEGDGHPIQGASAAVEMRAALREATKIPTSVGRIQLKMSVGVHTGQVDVFRAGRSHRELVITGEAATVATEMEHAASAGEILISPDLRDALPPGCAPVPKDPGFLLKWRKASVAGPGPIPRRMIDDGALMSGVPVVLRDHLGAGRSESEHRVATIGFVKFEGVAAVMKEGGAESVADGLERLVTAVQVAVDTEGVTFLATDVDEDGGKLILSAGVPVTQEDDEGRMLRALRAIADTPLPFPLKIGVNRGHVFSGDIGTDFRSTYTVMGDTVNLAARLMATAPSGAVYAAPSVLDRSHTVFATEALEPFYVKGKAEPVRAYAMGEEIATRTARTHAELPFTGRDGELAILQGALADLASGTGGAITLTGDTGFGKSRLVEEALLGVDDIRTFFVRAEPYGADNPYWAFRDPLRQLLGIERTAQTEMAARLAESVVSLAPDLTPLIPLIGDVTHIDVPDTPETAAIEARFRPDRSAAALVQMLEAALPASLAIVIEDGHWLDEASNGLVARLASEAHARPWLVLLTTRTAREELKEPLGTTIALGALPEEASRTLAIVATEAAPLRPHELETVVSRAAGNPLFLGEILRLVRETGSVEALPDSLDAVVGTEIDALGPLSRRLLRYSSILGGSFRRVVLDELLEPEDVVLDAATLRDLARFIEPDGDTRWRFRHSVMHDVAYQGLSYRKRRELHGRAGEVIERLAGEDTDAVAESLALHFAEAGNHEKAWAYGVIAGDRAKAAYANAEAAGHYGRALAEARFLRGMSDPERARVWTALGDVREQAGMYDTSVLAFRTALPLLRDAPNARGADLLLRIARAKMRAGRYSSALADLSRGLRLVDPPVDESDVAAAARLMSLRATVRVYQERYREALRYAHEAESLAVASDEREALAQAYGALDWGYHMLGKAEGYAYGPKALDLYRQLGQPDKAANLMLNLGAWSYYVGRWDEAVEWYLQARDEALLAGNDVAAATASANIGEVRTGQRRLHEAAEVLAGAVRVLRAAGDAYGALFAETQAGRLLLAQGDVTAASALFARLRAEALDLGQASTALEVAGYEAMSLTAQGLPEQALRLLEESERGVGDEAALLRSGVSRARAEALLALGEPEQAGEHVLTGLEAAREHDLAYDEAVLLELADEVAGRVGGAFEGQDAERAREIRARLGIVSQSDR